MLEFAESAPTTLPVCIVGAGPAGLIAANKLEAQGRKVVLFEKQNSVGGKNQAFYERSVPLLPASH
jgi:flavin-dependent dehydrogenase